MRACAQFCILPLQQFVNGAVAMVAGFRYDEETGKWDNDGVKDTFIKAYGAEPPDVLGEEDCEEMTDVLKHLQSQLGIEDERRAEELNTVIETLHGVELSRLQRKNVDSYRAFQKREIVAKWLHLHGSF